MIAVVGRANVGKSTLVNAILEEKVSIVSPIAQTTRNVIRGVLTDSRGQLVFLDTPGVHQTKSDLGNLMNKAARMSVEGVDVIMFMMDSSVRPSAEDEGWMRRLLFAKEEILLVLNKIDAKEQFAERYEQLWQDIRKEKETTRNAEWARTSAREGTGVAELTQYLFEHMPMGPMLFPPEMLSDFPRRLHMADVIREKLFQRLHDELPHSIAVGIEEIEETDDHCSIKANIYVNRPSQKGIVIGKKGRLLSRARKEAQAELAEVYEKEFDIELWVKVEKNWARNFFLLKKLGYQE